MKGKRETGLKCEWLLSLVALTCAGGRVVLAQTRQVPKVEEPQKILLWEGGAPGSLGSDEADKPSLNAAARDPIDRVGSRSDFVILAYPVISMTPP